MIFYEIGTWWLRKMKDDDDDDVRRRRTTYDVPYDNDIRRRTYDDDVRRHTTYDDIRRTTMRHDDDIRRTTYDNDEVRRRQQHTTYDDWRTMYEDDDDDACFFLTVFLLSAWITQKTCALIFTKFLKDADVVDREGSARNSCSSWPLYACWADQRACFGFG